MRIRYIFILLVVFLMTDCARVGRPTGGDKDELPPISISASPDFETINFNQKKIKIFFDEYIKFKDLNKQLVISPPLKYPPEITPLGTASKFISIKIKDTLKENTTYTFNFANAIVDNNEGNPLERFKYLFSTGSFIDSLSVSGTIQDAFNKKTDSNISVMLYAIDSTFNDSIIYKRKPDYIGNTLDSIVFSITNIKEGKYMLIALKDANNNMIYNPSEDFIGFIDKPILANKDTVYKLSMFKEQHKFSIVNSSETSKNHILIGYEGLLGIEIKELVDKSNNIVPFVSFKDNESDSIHIWHKDTASDSLYIRYKENDSIKSRVVRKRLKDKDSLQITRNFNQTLPLRDSLFILSNIPIVTIDKDKIKLIDKDSVSVPFRIIKDEKGRKFQIAFIKKHKAKYNLTLFPKAITDFLNHENDTIRYPFVTKTPEDYGDVNLEVVVSETSSPIIIEFLSKKGKLINRSYIKDNQTLSYSLLNPDFYIVRAIYDKNNNGYWDAGNFLQKRQAEKVVYFPKELEVRANWSLKEKFIIQ